MSTAFLLFPPALNVLVRLLQLVIFLSHLTFPILRARLNFIRIYVRTRCSAIGNFLTIKVICLTSSKKVCMQINGRRVIDSSVPYPVYKQDWNLDGSFFNLTILDLD